MPTCGPIYCVTLLWTGGFPAEPFNTFSNTAILFALLGFYFVRRETPRAADLYLLCALFLLNGIGSFLWHGTRTRWALTLDVMPALVLMLALVFFWARRVFPIWLALVLLAGFYVATQYLRGMEFLAYGRWASMAPAVVGFGIILIARTYTRSRPAALLGGSAIACAMLALTFRTIDRDACASIPFGTHFLWHIFLSAAAFQGIMAVLLLARRTTAGVAALRPAEAPAE
jgi:hypothetical protein